jgi:hypothetical protein
MSLYRLEPHPDLEAPTLIAALDSWVDAGSAATTAAARLAREGEIVARFEADLIFDYRARRPTLEIVDGRPTTLTWPELVVRRSRLGDRDLLVLSGPEPDYRWRQLSDDAVEMARKLGVVQWISIGSIPAAVPHTRPVPILGTSGRPGLLHPDVPAGPEGLLRVPAACISVLDVAVAGAGIDTVGYYAQVPHYISGGYPAAAIELLEMVARHLGSEVPLGNLPEEARLLRVRLDAVTGADDDTRAYVSRLESMVDESRLPSGDELISEIERFLRDRGTEDRRG